MNDLEAMKILISGQKIKKPHHCKDFYLTINSDGELVDCDGDKAIFKTSSMSIWEVYRTKEDNLQRLAKKIRNKVETIYSPHTTWEDIKELTDLILEDV